CASSPEIDELSRLTRPPAALTAFDSPEAFCFVASICCRSDDVLGLAASADGAVRHTARAMPSVAARTSAHAARVESRVSRGMPDRVGKPIHGNAQRVSRSALQENMQPEGGRRCVTTCARRAPHACHAVLRPRATGAGGHLQVFGVKEL